MEKYSNKFVIAKNFFETHLVRLQCLTTIKPISYPLINEILNLLLGTNLDFTQKNFLISV